MKRRKQTFEVPLSKIQEVTLNLFLTKNKNK